MKKTFMLIFLFLPLLAFCEGYPIGDCRPNIQKGIGVGNNNYHGHDCTIRQGRGRQVVILESEDSLINESEVLQRSMASKIEVESEHDYGEDE